MREENGNRRGGAMGIVSGLAHFEQDRSQILPCFAANMAANPGESEMKPTFAEQSIQSDHRPVASALGVPTGTILLTRDGEKPIERITATDHVITRDAGMVPVRSLARVTTMTRAILFAAGSLGHTRPDTDLVLPEAQPILIRDWRAKVMSGRKQTLIPAGSLVDGEFVRDLGPQLLTLYQIRFDTPHVIYAGGLELASGGLEAPAVMRPAA